MLALSHDNKVADGVRMVEEMYIPAAAKLAKHLEKHARYNVELAKARGQEAEKADATGELFSIVLILGVGLGVAAFGFVTYRHVNGSLVAIGTLFARVEKDLDFTERYTAAGSDELAELGRGFNRLLDRLQNSLKNLNTHASQGRTPPTK